jgi:hypothetical protein
MNIGIIIGMASITVGSVFLEDYLNRAGRTSEAQKVGMATSAGVSITAITMFISLIKALRSLG